MVELFSTILQRPIDLYILEDNQATIKVVKKGYSPKLRHLQRTQKINISSIKEVIVEDHIFMIYCHTTFQCADIFTKALAPHKWDDALKLLGIQTNSTKTKNKIKTPKEKSKTETVEDTPVVTTRGIHAAAAAGRASAVQACLARDPEPGPEPDPGPSPSPNPKLTS